MGDMTPKKVLKGKKSSLSPETVDYSILSKIFESLPAEIKVLLAKIGLNILVVFLSHRQPLYFILLLKNCFLSSVVPGLPMVLHTATLVPAANGDLKLFKSVNVYACRISRMI